MACSDYTQLFEFLNNGQFFDAVWCSLTNSGVVSNLLLGFWVFGAIALGFYIISDSIVLPLVLAIIMAGVWASFMVGQTMSVAVAATLLGISAAGYIIYRRMVP